MEGAAGPSVPWESESDFVEHRIDSSNRNADLVGGGWILPWSAVGRSSRSLGGARPRFRSSSQASWDRGGKSTHRGRPRRFDRLSARSSPGGPRRFPFENDDVGTDAE